MEKTIVNSSQSWEEPQLLNRSEVANLLRVSISYVDHLVDLPSYKIGTKKLFSKTEVLDYLRNHHVPSGHRIISKTDAVTSKERVNGKN